MRPLLRRGFPRVLVLTLGWVGGIFFGACTANRTATPGVNAGAAAVEGAVLGAASSAVSRATGGCYAACTPGTSCDPTTGYCVALPCQGRCAPDEFCDRRAGAAKERCVRTVQPKLEISGSREEPAPAAAPAKPTARPPSEDTPSQEPTATPASP